MREWLAECTKAQIVLLALAVLFASWQVIAVVWDAVNYFAR